MNLATSLVVALVTLVVVGCLVVRPGMRRRDPEPALDRRRLARSLAPWWKQLDDRRRRRLVTRALAIDRALTVTGAEGFEPNADQRLSLVAQIALCSLGATSSAQRWPEEITVYPDVADIGPVSAPAGLIEDLGALAAGDLWAESRLVVSWQAQARALENGAANPLVRALTVWRLGALDGLGDDWGEAFDTAYARWAFDRHDDSLALARPADRGRFVAAAAEAFFQRGPQLARQQPALYELIASYFDFDTARRRPAGHRTPRG